MYNAKIIKQAFNEFKRETMANEIYNYLDNICQNLLLQAVIDNRRRNPKAHQFTGNLINSIVIILYDKNEGIQSNYFAYDLLKSPIRKEMSAKNTRGGMRKNAVHFRPDWQNTPHSKYTPEVVTDESYGPNDAKSFAASWQPTLKTDFEICVAYTSEYAEWVELNRQTTGFLNSMRYAKQVMTGFGFKKIA